MQASETLMRMYEDLASRYARQNEPRMRDHCLVLAADVALKGGQPDQAERLRKRLLMTNPYHLLRPYSSMAEAMQSDDVQEYVADLRRKWPQEVVEQLLREVPSKNETFDVGVAEPASAASAAKPREAPEPEVVSVRKPRKEAKPVEPEPLTLEEDDAPVSAAGYWMAIVLFLLALAAAGGGLVMALGGPLFNLVSRAP